MVEGVQRSRKININKKSSRCSWTSRCFCSCYLHLHERGPVPLELVALQLGLGQLDLGWVGLGWFGLGWGWLVWLVGRLGWLVGWSVGWGVGTLNVERRYATTGVRWLRINRSRRTSGGGAPWPPNAERESRGEVPSR